MAEEAQMNERGRKQMMSRLLIFPIAAFAFIMGCDNRGGKIVADGSSTVYPVIAAISEEFGLANREVRMLVGFSGTGGGFKKFLSGETDINNASRPIKESELTKAEENGIKFIELPIAFDGLSVVVHPSNSFVDSFTVEELKRIWEPGSTVKKWSDVRPSWPDSELHLYGPDPDSGTFDYFTEAIIGEESASRSDYSPSADDNVLITGVSGDKDSLGFFGYAYYEGSKDSLKLVPIDGGAGPVLPNATTISNGTYSPLSRPLLIYVRSEAADRPEIEAFINYMLSDEGQMIIRSVGYVPMEADVYEIVRERFASRTHGTMYGGKGSQPGVDLMELLEKNAD